jgi:hypothetical protein
MNRSDLTKLIVVPASVFAVFVLSQCGSSNDSTTIAGGDGGQEASAEGGVFGKGDSGKAGLTCHSIGTQCQNASDCCVNVCTGGLCGGTALTDGGGGKACNTDAAPCAKGFDCCSGTCTNNVCVGSAPGASDGGATGGGSLACGAPANACKVAADCCSGLCEPVTGQAGVIQCLDACRADGVACTTAQDCCSLGCFGGVCTAGKLCDTIGTACTTNAQCCSSVCDKVKGECAVDVANSTCRPTGEDCGSGPQSGCCGATDKNDLCVNGRCTLPPTACKGLHATCATDGECCGKHCDTTTHTCEPAVACVPTAGACVTGADCCASSCTNGKCDAPVPGGGAGGGGGTLPDGAPVPNLCDPAGAGCATSATCCSGICLAGFCILPPR